MHSDMCSRFSAATRHQLCESAWYWSRSGACAAGRSILPLRITRAASGPIDVVIETDKGIPQSVILDNPDILQQLIDERITEMKRKGEL